MYAHNPRSKAKDMWHVLLLALHDFYHCGYMQEEEKGRATIPRCGACGNA
jgi:hypothetical protein